MEKTISLGAIGVRGRALAESLELARAGGFDSIVFDVREVARLADEHGIAHVRDLFARSGVRPGYWGLPVAWRQDDQWQEDLRALSPLAALARELGCVRVTTGVMPGSDDREYDDNFAWHVERLRPVAEVLRAEGCRLGIEFIGPKTFRARFRYEFIFTLDGTLELARAIGTGNIGVLLDSWHLYTSGGSVTDVERLTAASVVAVHVNDAPAGIPRDEQIDTVRALPLETGVIDLAGFMRRLQAIGYDGPVMLEPFSQRLESLAASDPVAAVQEAGRAMDALWRVAGLT